MTQYRIVGAKKSYHKSNYVIEKRNWWFPFWVEANDCSYETIDDAKKDVERLLTDVRFSSQNTKTE